MFGNPTTPDSGEWTEGFSTSKSTHKCVSIDYYYYSTAMTAMCQVCITKAPQMLLLIGMINWNQNVLFLFVFAACLPVVFTLTSPSVSIYYDWPTAISDSLNFVHSSKQLKDFSTFGSYQIAGHNFQLSALIDSHKLLFGCDSLIQIQLLMGLCMNTINFISFTTKFYVSIFFSSVSKKSRTP